MAIPAAASAAPITVNDTVDPGAPGGTCTLREAIVSANADNAGGNGCANGAGADDITFNVATPATITLNGTQLPALTGPLTITGPGVTVSGNFVSRVFQINAGVTVGMTGLTVAGGFFAGSEGADGNLADGDPGGNASGAGIHNAGNLTLTGVTVRDNLAIGGFGGEGDAGIINGDGYNGGAAGFASGGGVFSSGSLTVTDSTFSQNRALGGLGGDGGSHGFQGVGSGNGGPGGAGVGGAIANEAGTLSISGSTFSGNLASGDAGGDGAGAGPGSAGGDGAAGANGLGGAISSTGQATIIGSTLSGNEVTGGYPGDGGNGNGGGAGMDGDPGAPGNGVGAGISQRGTLGLTITNSTLSGNRASANQFDPGIGFGGGIATADTAPMSAIHVTAVDNEADFAANLGNVDGAVNLRATIIASSAPTAGATNCFFETPAATSNGFNLDDGTSCGFAPGTDLEGVEPQLGPLAAYGGPTQTHLPLTASPAVDAVTAGCPPPPNDQRGLPRVPNTCDIGAVERQPGDPNPGSGGGGGTPPPIQGSPPGAGHTGERAAALKKCKRKKSKKAKKNCRKRAKKLPV
jgi:CSLREA domain-containing protein